MDLDQVRAAVRRYVAEAQRGIHNGRIMAPQRTGFGVQGYFDEAGNLLAHVVVNLDAQLGWYVWPCGEIDAWQ